MGYGKKAYRMSCETMRMVRRATSAEEVRKLYRGSTALHGAEVLRHSLHGNGESEGKPDTGGSPGPIAERDSASKALLKLPLETTPREAPPGREPIEQLPDKRSYSLCFLPYAMALEAWEETPPDQETVSRVWRSVTTARTLPEALATIQETWRSAPDEKTRAGWALLLGPSLSERMTSHRREALKALGNAVCPWNAYVLGRAILSIEEQTA